MLDYAYPHWKKIQVDRVKDTIDITWLLAAKTGSKRYTSRKYCVAYRKRTTNIDRRYPDMSQNVDRHGNTAWGVTGWITPSGAPYSTTRGGPTVGIETLALQGISGTIPTPALDMKATAIKEDASPAADNDANMDASTATPTIGKFAGFIKKNARKAADSDAKVEANGNIAVIKPAIKRLHRYLTRTAPR